MKILKYKRLPFNLGHSMNLDSWDLIDAARANRESYLSTEYAGFLVRLVAAIIDSVIIMASVVVFGGAIMILILLSSFNSILGADLYLLCITFIGALMVVWLYYAWFESSRYMGTPGKMLVGIIVTDLNGERISFEKATLRLLCKTILNQFFYIGSFFILISDKKQGLYDMIASTLVVKKD